MRTVILDRRAAAGFAQLTERLPGPLGVGEPMAELLQLSAAGLGARYGLGRSNAGRLAQAGRLGVVRPDDRVWYYDPVRYRLWLGTIVGSERAPRRALHLTPKVCL